MHRPGWLGATCELAVVYAAGNPTLEPLLVANLPALHDAAAVSGLAIMQGFNHFLDALDVPLSTDASGCADRLLPLVEQATDDAETLGVILEAAVPCAPPGAEARHGGAQLPVWSLHTS